MRIYIAMPERSHRPSRYFGIKPRRRRESLTPQQAIDQQDKEAIKFWLEMYESVGLGGKMTEAQVQLMKAAQATIHAAEQAAAEAAARNPKTMGDLLSGSSVRMVKSSIQMDRIGGGGMFRANKDFDAITTGLRITIHSNGTRSAKLPDGTNISVRGHSTEGLPTIQINRVENHSKPIKVRYGQ